MPACSLTLNKFLVCSPLSYVQRGDWRDLELYFSVGCTIEWWHEERSVRKENFVSVETGVEITQLLNVGIGSS